ncbi:hypothetical protein GCM10022226_61820 [Sphaerisporangium flaviroseum]|uniref:PPM-type phosphatase domain-containing protein n=1 Tax=Sphaerisporangium flaviroseum TaxID=509199 RepID=A0ABP7J1E6_9ACTN
MTATLFTLPIGGFGATLTRRGPRDWNADHVAVRTTSYPGQVIAIAIADGAGDTPIAAHCAQIAAETTAAAAAHTAMAEAGIHAARQAVRYFYDQDPDEQTAVATIVTAVITDRGIDIAWVGDSVVFALDTDGVLHALTEPSHPLRPLPNNVTDGTIRSRFLWIADPGDQEVDLRLDVRRLLVTSDGLTHHITPTEISDILITADSPQTACQALADAAEDIDTYDNVTVAVIDLAGDTVSR